MLVVFLVLISSEMSVMCSISAMSATVKGGASRSRKRSQSEVGKRKNGTRFKRRQQKEHEGGMFSKNTHVLRNHTRKRRAWGRRNT